MMIARAHPKSVRTAAGAAERAALRDYLESVENSSRVQGCMLAHVVACRLQEKGQEIESLVLALLLRTAVRFSFCVITLDSSALEGKQNRNHYAFYEPSSLLLE